MSSSVSTPNLTSKFSRSSLKKATGHTGTTSGARVHSREEELARATNKRFNSESWRKVTRNYRAFPTTTNSVTGGSNYNGGTSNTQILCALSSLTEDQAFRTGSSDIPISLPRSSSYAGSHHFSGAHASPTLRRPIRPHMSSAHDGPTPLLGRESPYKQSSAAARILQTSTSSTASSSFAADEDAFHDCNTGHPAQQTQNNMSSLRQPLASQSPGRPSLRSAAGRVPRLPTRGLSSGSSISIKQSPLEQGRHGANGYTSAKRNRPASRSNGVIGSFKAVLSVFFKFFKLLHYLLMLPETIKQYFTRPRWSARGKCILITGASAGIGAEIARQYAAQGAKVALVARTSEDLYRVAEECRELGSGKALYYAADLANPVSIKLAMKQAMKDFGHFDVVVLNAGRSQGCYFEEIKDPSQIENMIKLNVNGAITCLHYVLPEVPKTSESRIVFISNTAGIVAAPYQSVYSATKHALSGFANSLRIELKTTYGLESPKICLVSLPEVSGTRCNTNRMDMGAKLPPAKWYSWAGMPLPQAVYKLIPAVAAGKREFGPPSKFNLWRSLYAVCPDWVDAWMMKSIQKTHYRPLEEKNKQVSSSNAQKTTASTPNNKSWAC